MDLKAKVCAQIERIWGAGEVELVDQLYAPGVVDHMPLPDQPAGREALKQVVRDFRAALPDLSMTLHGVLAKDGVAVDWWTLEGTHLGPLMGRPPTGRRVRFSGIDMVRTGPDGRITDLWHVEELLALDAQTGGAGAELGAPLLPGDPLPPPALDDDPGAAAWTPSPACLDQREVRNMALGRRHIEEMWAKGRTELAHEIYAPDIVDCNPAPGQRPGIDGIVELVGGLRLAAPDLRMTLEAYLVDGDRVVDRWVMEGTHSGAPLLGVEPRGRRFRFQGMDISRFRDDGLIDEVFHVEEFAQLRAQL
jgi:predicted ester cyclase